MNLSKKVEDLYPLSPMQQGILFHALLAPEAGSYLPQIQLSIEHLTDVPAFRAAWQQTIDQHPVLRTAFQWEQRDQPFQVVYRSIELPWHEEDWRDCEDLQQRLAEFLQRDRQQPFNLKAPPLMRLTLIRLGETHYHLIWTQHHLILDGWSAAIVLQDVFAAYQSPHSPIVRRPYRDYIACLQQQNLAAAKEFWQTHLQGFTGLTTLADRSTLSPAWDEQQITLSAETTATLQALVQQHQLTLNTLLQGVFGLLLSGYTGETDVVFGATSAGRSLLPGVEAMVGLFINTLPVRTQISPSCKLIPWLQQLQERQIEAMQYEFTPLWEIQDWLNRSGTPLFDSILVFENYPIAPTLLQSDSGLQITDVQVNEWTSFPLTVLVSASDRLTLKAKFDRHRFQTHSIDRLLQHLQILLESIAQNPERSLANFSFLTPAEQQQLQAWNQTEADYPQATIQQLFEAQVERSPDAIAVTFADKHLTYGELNAKANQLAHYLRSLQIQPEDRVGIRAARSIELAIGLLGILKSGAAYVPIDPSYPAERSDFMLKDAGVKVLLEGDFLEAVVPFPTTNPTQTTTPDHSAYIIYTSGSTGTPKGAINTHRAIVNRLAWMQSEYQLTPCDRVLQKTPISFDVSVWEFFWTWLNGACLVMAAPEGHQDCEYLARLIDEQQITTLHFVPTVLQVFLDVVEPKQCASLRQIFCSGEALPSALAARCLDRLSVKLHNLYGPTEAAIDVSYFPVTDDQVSIGRPIANTQLYILDRHLQQVPIGVAGELYIGGVGLARGYHDRPDLTADRFIPNPFTPGRLYWTGDRARFRPDGSIDYLGRLDYQVKLNGQRIELGEIEAVLMQHPDIRQAIVTLTPANILTAYLLANIASVQTRDLASLPADTRFPTPDSLRHFLQSKLPAPMIPAAFVLLDALPLLPNGKIDRRTLPQPNLQPIDRVPPRNPTEAIVAAIWAEVLQQEAIGVEENFFALGGNSLLATRVNSRLQKAFAIDLPLRTAFEKPTIAQLAERIDAIRLTQPQAAPIAAGRKEIEL